MNFQSHYGLILSRQEHGGYRWFQRYFQSHYGLILSDLQRRLYIAEFGTFNPTMVWFYREKHSRNLFRLASFNPTMVWFYHELPQTGDMTDAFLSIPLWSDFIDVETILRKIGLMYFQSHYGLILSVHDVMPFAVARSFQSHYGLILSWISPLFSDARNKFFQSHYGLILSLTWYM